MGFPSAIAAFLLLQAAFPVVSPAASVSTVQRAAEAGKKKVDALRADIIRKQESERRNAAELRRLDTELAQRRRAVEVARGEEESVEARIRSMASTRAQTDVQLAQVSGRLGDFLREWYEGDRDTSGSDVLIECASGEAECLANARVSRTEILQREKLLAEYRRRLVFLKSARVRRERDLESKRSQRAGYLSRLRGQIKSQTAMLALAQRDASRLEQEARRIEVQVRAAARASARTRTASPTRAPGRIPYLSWPVRGAIVTSFGRHRHKVFNALVNSRGIEIASAPGQRVRAAAPGKVVYSDWLQGYGRVMIVDHGSDVYTVYGHLQDSLVAGASDVKAGMSIGTVGEAGLWGNPSLYFEVRRGGYPVNPLLYLRQGG